MASPILTPGNNAEWVGSRKMVGRDSDGNYRILAINSDGEIVSVATSDIYGVDNDGQPVQPLLVDGGNQVTISRPHWEVHEGDFWTFAKRIAAVANDATTDFLIVAGATMVPHAVVTLGVTANCWADIYAAPNITDPGTEITAVPNNGASTQTPVTKAYYGPTVADTGDVAMEIVLPGGQKSNAIGSVARPTSEVILPASSSWLLRVTSKAGAGATADVGLLMEFYEYAPSAG